VHRTFRYRLRPGFIYSVTTTRGAGRGRAGDPPAEPMPLPFRATRDASNEPMALAAQDGSFEFLPGSSTTFEQTAAGYPVFWQNPTHARFPYAVLGSRGWRNYTVSVEVRFTGPGQSAGVITRFRHPHAGIVAERFYGYQFVVAQPGTWRLVRYKVGKKPATLAAGRLAGPLAMGHWTRLTLTSSGRRLIAQVDGKVVRSISNAANRHGDAGISTGGWYPVMFRNLTVTR
jgi:hypothetical protein